MNELAPLPPVFVTPPVAHIADTGLDLVNPFVTFQTYPAPVDLQVKDGVLVAHSVIGFWTSAEAYQRQLKPVVFADMYFQVDPQLLGALRQSAQTQLANIDFTTTQFGTPPQPVAQPFQPVV